MTANDRRTGIQKIGALAGAGLLLIGTLVRTCGQTSTLELLASSQCGDGTLPLPMISSFSLEALSPHCVGCGVQIAGIAVLVSSLLAFGSMALKQRSAMAQ